MATIRFKPRTNQPKEGMYQLQLIVTKNRVRKFVSLDTYIDTKYWDETQERLVIEKGLRKADAVEANNQRKKDNALIERYNVRANEIIDEYDRNGVDWTLNQFKDKFLNREKQGKVLPFMNDLIQNMQNTGHYGNARCYDETKHLMELYDPKLKERYFSEVDIRYVKKFDAFLEKRGCTSNSRFKNLKTLRALFNKAISEKEATRDMYPFGQDGFKVNNLQNKNTDKRYLPTEYLNKIKQTPSENHLTEFGRKLFLFSYYTYGMSWIDMAHLKNNNLIKLEKGTYIVYKRQKTGANRKPISIKLTKELSTLLNEIQEYKSPIENYLLPIVTINHTGEALHEHIKNRRKKYAGYLKNLVNEFELSFDLTTYVSRHTMAMQMLQNEIPENVISQVMNHIDPNTTKTYLDSLDTSVIDEASKVL